MDRKVYYDELVNRRTGEITQTFNGTYLHPNPRFYKYYWRIFHHGMPEGRAFFETVPLCTSEAMSLTESLQERKEGYKIYNFHRPRQGADVPFDFESEKWRDTTTAPPYDEDSDKPWNGHK